MAFHTSGPRRSLSEHLAAVTDLARPLPPRTTSARTGEVLAADVHALVPVPPFANSAMDGYLVNAADLDGPQPRLRVVGEVPAGQGPVPVPRGGAVRIMTGGPTGEDFAHLVVIPVELTDQAPGPGDLPSTITVRDVPHRSHIRPRGDNVAIGDLIARAGTLIDAATIASLVSAGVSKVSAHPRPVVAVISSGDELVAPGQPLGPGQLPDSNQPMIAELALQSGAAEVHRLHAGDSPDAFRRVVHHAAEIADLVITTGGVSAGAFDVVKVVGSESGAWFGSVPMKPGAPQGAGLIDGTPLLCLPGNPVAAYCSFEMFAVPVLRRLAGLSTERDVITIDYPQEFPRPDGRRHQLVPVRLRFAGEVTVEAFHKRGMGSHLVASLTGARGLAIIPPEVSENRIDVLLTRL